MNVISSGIQHFGLKPLIECKAAQNKNNYKIVLRI